VPTLDRNGLYLSFLLAYGSLCVNPLIYASRYEVFRRYLKEMLNKNSVTPGNAGGTPDTAKTAAGAQR